MPSSSARCSQLPRAVDKLPFYVALKKLRDHVRGDSTYLDESEICFPDLELKVKIKEEKTGNNVKDVIKKQSINRQHVLNENKSADFVSPSYDKMYSGMTPSNEKNSPAHMSSYKNVTSPATIWQTQYQHSQYYQSFNNEVQSASYVKQLKNDIGLVCEKRLY